MALPTVETTHDPLEELVEDYMITTIDPPITSGNASVPDSSLYELLQVQELLLSQKPTSTTTTTYPFVRLPSPPSQLSATNPLTLSIKFIIPTETTTCSYPDIAPFPKRASSYEVVSYAFFLSLSTVTRSLNVLFVVLLMKAISLTQTLPGDRLKTLRTNLSTLLGSILSQYLRLAYSGGRQVLVAAVPRAMQAGVSLVHFVGQALSAITQLLGVFVGALASSLWTCPVRYSEVLAVDAYKLLREGWSTVMAFVLSLIETATTLSKISSPTTPQSPLYSYFLDDCIEVMEQEYTKSRNENGLLTAQIKELEEFRGRLERKVANVSCRLETLRVHCPQHEIELDTLWKSFKISERGK